MKQLKGEIAVVTGASTGIGKAIALQFIKEGASVFLISQSDKCIKIAKKLSSKGYSAYGMKANLENESEIDSTFHSIFQKTKKIDILINNAGISQNKLCIQINLKDWNLLMNLNLRASFLCTKIILKYMLRKKKGKIVNISSIVGMIGNSGQSHYSASKAGLITLTKSIAKEVAHKGIQINSISPGFIKTKMLNQVSKNILSEYLKRIPQKRFGEPKEIAYLVTFLSSKKSSYITGQNFVIDGGLMMYDW